MRTPHLPIRVLDRTALERLFDDLAADLREPAELTIVGGAWMAMHDLRLSSLDVDCVGEVPSAVRDAAAEVGALHWLPAGWCNNAATPWAPPGAGTRALYRTGGLVVVGLDADAVFVMKVARSAPIDRTDLRLLWPLTTFADAAAAAAALRRTYPHEPADPYLEAHIAGIVAS